MSTDWASPTPSVTESCEAALRRLLASRAIAGHPLTFDDPASGSLAVFQSSRVALPQDAPKAPDLVSLLSSSARSFLDTQLQRMLGLAGRFVDSVFQHSWCHYEGFIRDLVKAGSAGLLNRLWNTLVSFSLPRRLVLRG